MIDTVEILSQSDFEATLAAAIEHLRQTRESQEKQKLIATLRRSTEDSLGADQEVDLLRKLQEQAKQSSARRSMM